MRDVIEKITQWADQGESIALATVIQTWGSSPRPVGADMAISGGGEITGSVSGGCVEGAVVETALDVLESGHPQLLHFGVTDQTAWHVGLSCGGKIEVFVRPLKAGLLPLWQKAVQENRPSALATVIHGPQGLLGRELALLQGGDTHGSLSEDLDAEATALIRAALSSGTSRRVQLEPDLELFINVELPSPTLVIVGGSHIAIPLVSLAKTLNYHTVLIDPRRNFGNPNRFPHVDRLFQAWPNQAFEEINVHSSTAIATLTHDPKIDDPALKIALKSQAFYVGALGSRKTQNARRQRLLEEGLTTNEIDRLHAPIGLDLGGRSPEEIALAIMAEIIQARYGRDE